MWYIYIYMSPKNLGYVGCYDWFEVGLQSVERI